MKQRAQRMLGVCVALGLWVCFATESPAATSQPSSKKAQTITLSLAHQQPLTVKAEWSKITASSMRFEAYPLYKPFLVNKVAVAKQRYTRNDLQAFLPKRSVRVGEVWQIEEQQLHRLFLQFHPNAVMHMHDGGPRGAYAMLRAVSPRYAEVVVRVHVQFLLGPRIFYTPAQFRGRLVFDRKTQKLAVFQLTVPTERTRNIDLNVGNLVDAVYVPRMALSGELPALSKQVWSQQVSMKHVERVLGQRFYAFLKIKWMSVSEALKAARREKKPLHVFTVFGSLDDQSC